MDPVPIESPLAKEACLKDMLAAYGSVAVAYSGGVDSTYLADVAIEVLGKDARLFIADTPSFARAELDAALTLAHEKGWPVEALATREFRREPFLKNDALRCYYCKQELFSVMAAQAQKHHLAIMVHGETAEDAHDTSRVGIRAAREAGIRAPLAEAGFTKADIRERSRARTLPTWNKASFACLASRVPTDTPLTVDLMAKIEQAETLLRALGCRQYRARHHGDLCRIEVEPEDMLLLLQKQNRSRIITVLNSLGYRHVTLDLRGYTTGGASG